jgi:lysophospholipase L1-like esterase
MRRVARFLGLIAVGVLLAAMAGEIYCRLKFPGKLDERWLDPYTLTGAFRVHALGPEAYGYRDAGWTHVYDSDAKLDGVQARWQPLYPRPVPPGERRRVFVVGGSVALGDGASTGATRWWRVLEEKLRAALHDDKIDVIPAAMQSFVTTQERITLELYVLPLKPDVVVVLDGFNDAENLAFGVRPGDPYNLGTAYTRYDSLGFHVWLSLARHSALARWWLERRVAAALHEANVHRTPAQLTAWEDSAVNIYRDNVTRMARRCAQESVPCLFFAQPARELTVHHYGGPETPTTRMLARMAATQGVVDLTHLLDARRESYVDVVHFDDGGQQLLADAVLAELVKRLSP